MARSGEYPELSRGKTGTTRTKSRIPQSSAGIHPDRWSAPHRNPGKEQQAVGNAAARCRYLHRNRRRRARWDKGKSGRHRSIQWKGLSTGAAKKYSVLFGEGVADWKALFHAAEN